MEWKKKVWMSSVCVCVFVCVRVCASSERLHRILFSNASFFRFVLRIVRLKKKFGPCRHFVAFWAIFPIFFLIFDFFPFSNIQ